MVEQNKTETSKQYANPREIAILVLNKVTREGGYSNIVLGQELNKKSLNHLDKSLLTEIVYGTLRQQGTLDYILTRFLSKPLEKLPLWILIILRTGLYQLYFMDKVPASAAINQSVELAKKYGHKGTAGLVNGTLRNIERNKDQIQFPDKDLDEANYIAICYSHPKWLIEYWLQFFTFDEVTAICQYNNSTRNFVLRVNTLKTTRDDLLEALASRGIEILPDKHLPEAIILPKGNADVAKDLILNGMAYPQHQASMLAAYALRPTPGSKVIDACAAPGGKTTHMAALMNNQGEILAFDQYEHKKTLIEDNCRRLGVDIVHAEVADSRNLPENLDNWADFALIDAPCSGLGVLQSRPDARWQKTQQTIGNMAVISYDILCEISKKVKVGGVILYSTCTIAFQENQGNVEKFLKEHDNYVADKITDMPYMFYQNESMWQMLPHKHDMDGFFLARLKRVK